MFAIRNLVLLLFVIRNLILFAQITWITNSEYSITTSFFGKCFNFFNVIVNVIFYQFRHNILLSISIKSCDKGIYWYVFTVLYVYIVLDKKLINLFGKNIVANNIVYLNLTK